MQQVGNYCGVVEDGGHLVKLKMMPGCEREVVNNRGASATSQ